MRAWADDSNWSCWKTFLRFWSYLLLSYSAFTLLCSLQIYSSEGLKTNLIGSNRFHYLNFVNNTHKKTREKSLSFSDSNIIWYLCPICDHWPQPHFLQLWYFLDDNKALKHYLECIICNTVLAVFNLATKSLFLKQVSKLVLLLALLPHLIAASGYLCIDMSDYASVWWVWWFIWVVELCQVFFASWN